MIGLVSLLIFASVVLAGYGIALWAQQHAAARQALVKRLHTMAGPGMETFAAPLLKDERLSSIPTLNALLGMVPFVRGTVRMVRQAGLKRRVGEVLLYIPLLACITLLITLLAGGGLLVGIGLAVVAGAIPLVIVSRIRAKRRARFTEQLPDALDLVRSALQAGHGFLSALGVVAETFPEPISQEFRWVTEEVRLGLPLRDALYHLADRVDDGNVPILVIGVLVAQEVGGNLAEVIENIAHTIRERAKLMRDVQVMTAQGRLSGRVLTVLPFLLGSFFYFLQPKYFGLMLTTSGGQKMLAYAACSVLMGHLVIRRLVTIKV